ncbi:MAG: menaquinol oxidoreductase, partial [Desulfosporosinus sp.]|nr:menaquinol oxidoreductase [Desulfosporosinus sp.]
MKVLFSFLAVILIILVATMGAFITNLHYVFGIIIPYLAFAMFVGGFIYRVIKWGR